MVDPVQSAKICGLRYVTDDEPGYTRRRRGKAFTYHDARGKKIADPDTLRRIRSLVIPPAWERVWISPLPDGHLQATGRDARGRKQYRYHPRWRATRDETKYHRMIAFGMALPLVRAQVERDLGLPGLPREKVLATVVRLLETTLIRVGNSEYARTNNSFGLTTLKDDHVDVAGSRLRFSFRGKAGVRHEIAVTDRRLARIVRRCRDLPGQELFQYLDDDGERRAIGSSDVNDYLREITGQDFTSKDFRTWAGTVLAARELCELAWTGVTQAKRNVVRAVEEVSKKLGNTRSVCRRCYIHPAVIDSYLDGSLKAIADDRGMVTFLKRRARANRPSRDLTQLLRSSIESAGRRAAARPARH